jgi:hypothetical protein
MATNKNARERIGSTIDAALSGKSGEVVAMRRD